MERRVRLNNGIYMPIIGIGVYSLTPSETENSVYSALKEGYRLVDTARIYGNEDAVGRAIKRSGIPRGEIFITTKLWISDFPNAKERIEERLTKLDVDYIDLLLLHHPGGGRYDKEAYKAMEEAVKEGKIKSIGLSNYNEKEFEEIIKIASIVPAVVQNETHPYNQQKEFKVFLEKYGTVLESWFPLGGRKDADGRGGTAVLFNNETILKISKKYNKSPAQIILRWHLQSNNIAIPGSRNPEHIKENIEIFDFELSSEDMQKLNNLDKKESFATWL
ncbi:MAG TPA: aldo/keto reductase [Pasteurellaceae bacterium]|nr:aldo/keto reductase [Pasteurellaceae bacterium]